MPERIQLSRAKGWRMPANTVKVDHTTKFGNPFVPGKPVPVGPLKGRVVADKRHAFVLFRSFAELNPKLIEAARSELAGKDAAKAAGASWNAVLKKWCCKPSDTHLFEAWLPRDEPVSYAAPASAP